MYSHELRYLELYYKKSLHFNLLFSLKTDIYTLDSLFPYTILFFNMESLFVLKSIFYNYFK